MQIGERFEEKSEDCTSMKKVGEAVEKANALHAVVVELMAAKNRFWGRYRELCDAVDNAATQEEWAAARAALQTHNRQVAPCEWEARVDWIQAKSDALQALADWAGLQTGVQDE